MKANIRDLQSVHESKLRQKRKETKEIVRGGAGQLGSRTGVVTSGLLSTGNPQVLKVILPPTLLLSHRANAIRVHRNRKTEGWLTK